MNKNEFLNELRTILWRLPEEERESALTYYEEFIEDAGPENERQVISKLGTPQRVADNIFREFNTNVAVSGVYNYSNTNDVRQENSNQDYQGQSNQYNNNQGQNSQYSNNQGGYSGGYTNTQGQSSQYNSNNQRSQKNTTLWIILLVICSPLILGLGGGAFGILVGLIAAAFGIVVAAIASVISLIVGGIVMIIAGISGLSFSTLAGLLLIGVGLVALGLGLLLFVPTMALIVKVIPAFAKGVINLFKKPFTKNKHDQYRG